MTSPLEIGCSGLGTPLIRWVRVGFRPGSTIDKVLSTRVRVRVTDPNPNQNPSRNRGPHPNFDPKGE